MFGKWSKRLGFSAVSLIAVSGAFYKYKRDLDLQRSFYFWRNVIPIFVHYKSKEIKFDYFRHDATDQERAAEFNVLHKKYADKIVEIVMHLRGFYVKIGQMAAQRVDTIPLIWAQRLKKLESEMTPKGFDEIREVIENEYNVPLETHFSFFEPIPIGCASIGQVHKAYLRETGEKVAVKVLHSDARAFFRSDLGTLKRFTKIAQRQMLPFLKQWEALFEEEFDCRREAEKIQRTRHNLVPWRRKIVIPQIVENLCGESVVVMEFLEGQKLSDMFMKVVRHYRALQISEQERTGTRKSLKTLITQRKDSKGLAQRTLAGTKLIFEFFFASLGSMLHKISFGLIPRNLFIESELMTIVRLKGYLDTLQKVHAYEVFVNGFFNPDPHGGNVLVMPDGRLGLVDFGQATSVSDSFRHNFSRLIVALDDEDWDATAKWNRAIGFRTTKNDPFVSHRSAQLFFGSGNTGDLVLPQYMERLYKNDQPIDYPADLFLAGKLAMILRSMLQFVESDVSIAKLWRPFAEKCLEENLNANSF